MITLNFCQLKRRQKKDGTTPVWLRVTENGESRYISTGVSVFEKDWNQSARQVKKSNPSHKALNQILDLKIHEARTELLRLSHEEAATLDVLVNNLKSEARNSGSVYFENYMESLIEAKIIAKTHHPLRKARHALSKFRRFRNGKRTPLDRLDSVTLSAFVNWLRTELGNKDATISKDMVAFKQILNQAHKEGIIRHIPDFPKLKLTTSIKYKLDATHIAAIERLDLEPGSKLWHTRNYWLFSFYYAGIRWSDLCRLKWSNIKDGRIYFTAAKTNKAHVSFLMPAKMHEILNLYRSTDQSADDFVFPILPKGYDYSSPDILRKKTHSQNALTNSRLKEIARMAGIEINLSTHIARHSAAVAFLKNGQTPYQIQQMLSHSSLKVTEGYLGGFVDVSLEGALHRVFDK